MGNQFDSQGIIKKLWDNGFVPLPMTNKVCVVKKWPSHEPYAYYEYAPHITVGMRVHSDMVAIDIDTEHEDISLAITPEIRSCIEKHGGPIMRRHALYKDGFEGYKNVFLVRVPNPESYNTNRIDRAGQFSGVEVHSSNSNRLIGSFGQRCVNSIYKWENVSPLDVLFSDIPILSSQFMPELKEIIKKYFEDKVCASGKKKHLFNIEPGTVFKLIDGSSITADLLAKIVRPNESIRVSAGGLDGGSDDPSKCVATMNNGILSIYNHKTEEVYLPADAKQRSEATISQMVKFDETIDNLLQNYVFCAKSDNPVFHIDSVNESEGVSMRNFTALHMHSSANLPQEHELRQHFPGSRKVNPAVVWLSHPQRIAIDGIRFDPSYRDRFFVKQDKLYLNSYVPNDLDAPAGWPERAQLGYEFFGRLIPDDSERSWFIKWLSHKIGHPQVRGPAIVFVAHNTYGTGRGTLKLLIERMVGRKYVKTVPFNKIAGTGSQSQYNDWLPNSLFAFVDESSSQSGASYSVKRSTFETLKELVDPRQGEMQITLKRVNNYFTDVYTTFVICTNHRDALPIAPGDRRFAVITNGNKPDKSFWDVFYSWLDDPLNIASFKRALIEESVEGYSPYEVPETWGKHDMTALNTSTLDELISETVTAMEERVFTIEKFKKKAAELSVVLGIEIDSKQEAYLTKVARSYLFRVGGLGSRIRVNVDGKRLNVYTKTRADAEYFAANQDRIRL